MWPSKRLEKLGHPTQAGLTLAYPEPYHGQPSSDIWTKWRPEFTRGNTLYGAPGYGGWVCGSLNWGDFAAQYGRFEMTVQSYLHEVLSFHALLWPLLDHWPPEIDIAEMFDETRQRTDAFVHGGKGENRTKQQFHVMHDVTKPTTFAVEWRPESLRLFCDGEMFGETTDSVPQEPMRLVIQVETHTPPDQDDPTETTGPPTTRGDACVTVLGASYTALH